jgi:hypothetical protein
MQLTISYVNDRLVAFLKSLEVIESQEFPNSDALELANYVKMRVSEHLSKFEELNLNESDEPGDVASMLEIAGQLLEQISPLISYASRASESRNPHELLCSQDGFRFP